MKERALPRLGPSHPEMTRAGDETESDAGETGEDASDAGFDYGVLRDPVSDEGHVPTLCLVAQPGGHGAGL